MMLLNNQKMILFNFCKKKIIIQYIIIVLVLIVNNFAYSTVDLVVNEICFSGLQRTSLDTALFHLPFKIGSSINENVIANSIKSLFATGCFEAIVISHTNNGIITIQVSERPIINILKLHGNKTVKSEFIQEILNTKKIKSGELLNKSIVFEAKRELEELCYSFGKFNATVEIIFTPLDRNRVDIDIKFFEGKTIKIDRIDIFGNRDFSQKQLLKQFKSYNQKKWSNILLRKQYQKQKLLFDLELLHRFYLNYGYAKFHINDTKIDFDSNKEKMYLSVFITEGLQYFFQSLIICGNVLNYIPEIKEYIQILSGELYSNIKIQEIESKIQYILGKYGYIQPKISMEYDFNDDNKTVKLYVYIDVGNRFYIREIRFEGNDITKDSVLRREIQQIEQNPLNYVDVIKDQERLRKLDYFKQVDTRVLHVPNLPNQVDLIYLLTERDTGNLNASVGIGTESGLNMQVGMRQDNLLGTGNSISITATKNRYQTYFDILTIKKCFGIEKKCFSGKMFYSNLFNYKTDSSNYTTKNYGININCLYPIDEYKTYNIGFDYVSRNLNHIMPQIAIWRYLNSMGINPLTLVKDKCLNNGISLYTNDLILVSGWTVNTLNRTYFPTSGSLYNIIGRLTLPGSNNKYYKVIIDGAHYVSLDKYATWVLMNSIYVGYASGLFKPIESPFYDNFYIGGIGTIRGFKLNSIGPKAVYYDCSNSNINYDVCSIKNFRDTIGGNAVVYIRNELQLPISWFVNNSEYFNMTRISLFVDCGTIWDTNWKNTETTRAAGIMDYSAVGRIRISSGIALKWMSPIGPIIFSYSKLIKKYSEDIEEPFQFSIGKVW